MRHYLTDPKTGRKVYAASPEDEVVPLCAAGCGNVVTEEGAQCLACVLMEAERAEDEQMDAPGEPWAQPDGED